MMTKRKTQPLHRQLTKWSLLFIIITTFMILDTSVPVAGSPYTPVVYLVDSDSNVDGVANYGQSPSGTYTNTQALDGVTQNNTEYWGGILSPDPTMIYEPFTDPAGYLYDPDKVNVSDGYAQLEGIPFNHSEHARYELNEGSGNDTIDSTVNNWNGTLEGGGVTWDDSAIVNLNKRLMFNNNTGGGGYVNLSSDLLDSSLGDWEYDNAFSISVWSNHSYNPVVNTQTIISKQDWLSRGWMLHHFIGLMQFELTSNPFTNERILMRSQNAFPVNQTIHIVVTYNGGGNASDVNVYWDNVLQPMIVTYDMLNNKTIHTWASLLLGARQGNSITDSGAVFNETGSIDQVILFDKELNQTEIDWLYNSGFGTEELYLKDYPTNTDNSTIVTVNPVNSNTPPVGIFSEGFYPTGTSARFQISPDNGTTWYRWDAPFVVAIDDWAFATHPVVMLFALQYWHTQFPNPGNFSYRVFFRTTVRWHTPKMNWTRIEMPNWKTTIEHQFDDIPAAQYTNLSVYATSTDSVESGNNENITVQLWNGTAWENGTDTGGNPLTINGSIVGGQWYNWTIEHDATGDINIQFIDVSRYPEDYEISTILIDYVAILTDYDDDYGTPIIVAWFDSYTLIDPFADVLFDCTIYDIDNTSSELNVTLWYSNDSFGAINISVQMSFSVETSPNHYKFTYLFPGEAAGVAYQYYYQVTDDFYLTHKPAAYDIGIFFDIQWDLIIEEVTPGPPGGPAGPGPADGTLYTKDYTSLFNFLILLIFVMSLATFIVVYMKDYNKGILEPRSRY